MAQPTSYPSPTQSQMAEGAHPFFTSQPQSQPEGLDMHSSARHQGASALNSHVSEANMFVPRDSHVPNQYHGTQSSPRVPIQSQVPPAQDPNLVPQAGKRTKTSRACDQCRAKKTRCDEIQGSVGQQCVGCRRNNQMCEFSREPQKRGPSKGYIKELAERVGALEHERLQRSPEVPYANMTPVPHQQQHGVPSNYMDAPLDDSYGSRKRTHSSTQGLQTSPFLEGHSHEGNDNGPSPAFTSHWSKGAPNSNPTETSQSYRALRLQRSQPVDINDRASSSQQPFDVAMASASDATEQGPPRDFNSEGNPESINFYYQRIHPFFPFLPHKTVRLLSNLADVSPSTREAFWGALQTLAQPGQHDTIPSNNRDNSRNESARLVFDLQRQQHAAQSPEEKLVTLQAILLMIFATEISGPAHTDHLGWFSQAFGAASFHFYHIRHVRDAGKLIGHDPDEHHLLARRAWLTFVALERWHAAGIASPSIVSDDLTELCSEDHAILGDVGYYLLRSSSVLSHVMDAKIGDMSLNTFDLERWKLLHAEKTQIRDTLEDRSLPPPIECLSVTLDLFVNYYNRSERHGLPLLKSTIDQAIRVLHILFNGVEMNIYNMNHHFLTLAAMVLVEALKHHDHKDQALAALDELTSNLWGDKISIGAGDRWLSALRKFTATSIAQHLDASGTANGGPDRAGLQHLADAAVGETETAAGSTSRGGSRRGSREYISAAPKGYLTMLAQFVRSPPEV